MITVDDVGLALGGVEVLRSIRFGVAPGEFICLVGPSGCGKSTLLRLLGGLLAPSRGAIEIGGRPAAVTWQDVGFVFQSPRLVPWRDAIDNVVLGMQLRFRWRPAARYRERARVLLDLVGLAADGHKLPGVLSGGERQRVAIARALALDPPIILMDEPFSALDLRTRERLRLELIDIWQRTGKTIIFVTHDVDESIVLADRIVVLSAKPTTVVEILAVQGERPRSIAATPHLTALRERLLNLLRDPHTGELP